MTDDDRAKLTAEARARLERIAMGLLPILDPVTVAASFLGVGVTVAATYFGTQNASEYLGELVAGLERDEDDSGHA